MDHSVQNRSRKSLIAGWVSIIINLFLFVIKYMAGVVSGSVAIIADAWHTLSDSISSILVVGGVMLSRKPADKNHPFGHGRYELVVTIIIGCILIWIAYNFFVQAVDRLVNREAAQYGLLAIVVTLVSVVVKEALAQYSFYIARIANSRVVAADGWHHRSDAISSAIILVGILLGRKIWWMDGVLGIIVALLILYTAFTIIKDASNTIAGKKPSPKLLQSLVELINEAAGTNVFPHHFHLHDYINHKELTLHIYLPDHVTIQEAHLITNLIEDRIKEEMDITATIHVEPHAHMPIDNDKLA